MGRPRKQFNSADAWNKTHKAMIGKPSTIEKGTFPQGWDALWLKDFNLATGLGSDSIQYPYKEHETVYACITKIARSIAQVPFVLNHGKKALEKGDNLFNLFRDINPQSNKYLFFEGIITHLMIDGNVMVLPERSVGQETGAPGAIPSELWAIRYDRFKPVTDPETKKLIGWIYKPSPSAEGIPFKVNELIHVKLFNPYDLVNGLSPMTAARMAVDTDYKAKIFNKAFFENSAIPSLAITLPEEIDPDEYDAWVKRWEDRHKGASKSKKVAVLEGGATIKELGLSHHDMEFLKQMTFNQQRICMVYGVPPPVIGVDEQPNYANIRAYMRSFWTETLVPIIKNVELEFETSFFPTYAPGYSGKFDLTQVPYLQEELKTKIDNAYKLWQMGMTGNEINEELDLGFEDKPWRDIAWMPVNMQPVDQLMNPDPPPEGEPEKVINPAYQKWKRNVCRAFNRTRVRYEKALTKKLQAYFWKQRSKVLKALAGSKTISEEEAALLRKVKLSFELEDERLVKTVSPLFEQIAEEGMEIGAGLMGADVPEILPANVTRIIRKRKNKIKKVNKLNFYRIKDQIHEGLTKSENINQISDRIRKVYNFTKAKSVEVAQTETGTILNTSQFETMKELGAPMKSWGTMGDGVVRESHEICEAQGAIPITEPFANGLMYPGDPGGDAEEVCNCRCNLTT